MAKKKATRMSNDIIFPKIALDRLDLLTGQRKRVLNINLDGICRHN
jgi:hypothetical protein